jgi:cation:H+ antiporter
MGILFWIIVLLVSLIVLIKASDYFVKFGSKIGLLLNIPQFVIGITIIALGTSAPELVTSIIAMLKGNTEFVAGTVVGSNIANILVIVGVSAIMVKHIRSKWDLIRVDIPILVATTLLLIFVLVNDATPVVVWYESLILLGGYLTYIWYFTSIHSQQKVTASKPEPNVLLFLGLLGCMAGIYIGGEYTMRSVIALKDLFGLTDTSIIGISAIAIATSLPELVVSITAIRKHNIELAFGNILGSNVFNTCVVLGASGLIGPVIVSSAVIKVGIPFLIAAIVLYSVSLLDRKITKYEGVYFLLLYLLFLVSLAKFV